MADVLRVVQLAPVLAADADQPTTSPGCGRCGSISRRAPARSKRTPIVANGVMYITSGPTSVSALDLQERQAALGMDAADRAERAEPRLPARQPRRRDPRRHGLRRHARRLPGRARREGRASSAGRCTSATTRPATRSPPRRSSSSDKVIVGISGGEAGIRGFLDAYDAKTGKQVWRFWTVPSPGEPGSDTWPGDSWVHGGGATWLTGSYDPALKLLYWGTGNPGPDWNGDSRKGDNLYTSSLVAIDVETGKARWHFQFTPHDVHDWDANQIPGARRRRDRRADARAGHHGEPQRLLLRARSRDRRVPRRHASTRSRRGPKASTSAAGRS